MAKTNYITGFDIEIDACVATLLRGVPQSGGAVDRATYELLVRSAFQEGVIAAMKRFLGTSKN